MKTAQVDLTELNKFAEILAKDGVKGFVFPVKDKGVFIWVAKSGNIKDLSNIVGELV